MDAHKSNIDDDRDFLQNIYDFIQNEKRIDGDDYYDDYYDGNFIFKRQAARFIFPPTTVRPLPVRRLHKSGSGQVPLERQSYGRQHHWDTYFGRRR